LLLRISCCEMELPGSVRRAASIHLRKIVMAEQRLQRIRVAILATNGFEEVELTAPNKALEEAGRASRGSENWTDIRDETSRQSR
jgi:hypothetical protein